MSHMLPSVKLNLNLNENQIIALTLYTQVTSYSLLQL